MAVDNPGRRRQHGRNATERGFEPLRLRAIQPFQILDPVAVGGGGDFLETRDLGFAGGDNQLADAGVRDAMLAAIGIEALAAGDAAAPLQAANRVIEPAMDDFAVARRGLETDRVGAFEDEHAMAGKRQRPSRRETQDARPDHDAVNLVHHISWAKDSCRI